jgi:hypothetical protein
MPDPEHDMEIVLSEAAERARRIVERGRGLRPFAVTLGEGSDLFLPIGSLRAPEPNRARPPKPWRTACAVSAGLETAVAARGRGATRPRRRRNMTP